MTHAQPISVRVQRAQAFGPAALTLEQELKAARALANWMDTRFSFLGYRFGFETILGLLPGIGDTLGALIGLYPLFVALRHKLGWRVQVRMGLNLLIEWLIGLVPVLGDLFDTVFKANVRNVAILEAAARARVAP